jgi:hypothetical protein
LDPRAGRFGWDDACVVDASRKNAAAATASAAVSVQPHDEPQSWILLPEHPTSADLKAHDKVTTNAFVSAAEQARNLRHGYLQGAMAAAATTTTAPDPTTSSVDATAPRRLATMLTECAPDETMNTATFAAFSVQPDAVRWVLEHDPLGRDTRAAADLTNGGYRRDLETAAIAWQLGHARRVGEVASVFGRRELRLRRRHPGVDA